jgi:hypothetical protein
MRNPISKVGVFKQDKHLARKVVGVVWLKEQGLLLVAEKIFNRGTPRGDDRTFARQVL